MVENKYLKSVILTSIFILIIGMYYVLFGTNNIALAIMAILAISKLSKEDFTISPKSEFVKLLAGFIGITVMAEVASLNIYLSIVINLVTIYLIGALNLCTLDKGYYNTFLMGYVYMLIFSSGAENFKIRLLAVVFCVLIIMFIKLVLFKVRYKDLKLNILKDTISLTMKKIENIKTDFSIEDLNEKFYENINELDNLINNTRAKEMSISKKDSCLMDLMIVIEKINMFLDKINHIGAISINDDKRMDDIYDILQCINSFLSKKKKLPECMSELNLKCENLEGSNANNDEILYGIIEFIKRTIGKYIFSLDESKLTFKGAIKNVFNKDKITSRIKSFYNEKNESYYFNLRMTLAITIAYLVGNIYDSKATVCFVLSAFAIVQVDSKNTMLKSLMKIKGTIIGGIVCILFYKYVHSFEGRMLIIIVAVYFITLIKDYDKLMIFSTIASIGISELSKPSLIIIEHKLIWICIGIGLGLLATIIIRPYKFSNEFKKIINKVRENDKKLLEALKQNLSDEDGEIKDLLLNNNLMIDYLDNLADGNKKYKIFKNCHSRIAVNEELLFKMNRIKDNIAEKKYKRMLITEIEEDVLIISRLKAEEIK